MKLDDTRNDIMGFFYALLHDNALERLRFFKFQQTLMGKTYID